MKNKKAEGKTKPIDDGDIIQMVNFLKKPIFPKSIDKSEDQDRLKMDRERIIENSGDKKTEREIVKRIGVKTWKIAVTIGGGILIGIFLRKEFIRLHPKEEKEE